ncbi:MAG: hypothetical protein R3330_14090 [Saprospiraceae bacterium]|nr:hypothetical protein [Saprospiraceae bacterium]
MLRWDFFTAIGGMRVGDSFFIPCLQCDEYRKEIRFAANKLGVRVLIRQWTDDFVKGLRIWRTL